VFAAIATQQHGAYRAMLITKALRKHRRQTARGRDRQSARRV
jgi:hypothetical protein